MRYEARLFGTPGIERTVDTQRQEARDRLVVDENQDGDSGTQTVRVRGHTAVVTAHLRIKATTRRVAFLS